MTMPRDVFHLDDEQFAKLVDLLTPGYELAKAYLAASKTPASADEQSDAEQGESEAQEAADGAAKSD